MTDLVADERAAAELTRSCAAFCPACGVARSTRTLRGETTMEAKKIKNDFAQGDLYGRRVTSIPATAKKAEPVDGKHVVAHSETGHHHYLDSRGVERFEHPADPFVCYLRIEGGPVDGGAVLMHARPYHTHGPIALGAGCWEIRRQGEMTPEGWRQVQD